MCSITGVDYGRIIRSLDGKLAKPAIDLPPDSLIGDWLDGYAQVQTALVRGLLRGVRRRARRGPPRRAAIVGYLMDRNEADHLGNLAELRRMLAALGLETVSVWLGGEPAAALARAAEADLVVSLPYGRAAARDLARLTGARLVETELPFGLPKTERFLRDVGKAAGRPKQAEAFLSAELSRVIPRLKWIVPQCCLNRRVAFMGDPYLFEGFCDIAEDLGLVVEGAIVRSQSGPSAHGGARPFPVLYAPRSSSPEVRRLVQAPLDLFVTCWCEQDFHNLRFPVLEFGFPSYRSHALHERPFLGANGMLAFVERMAEKLGAPRPSGRG
jgi:nitrogenase molybdenum-iron protein alpha/beta subunit